MDKNYTMKTDVWSVGCVLGELLNFSNDLKGIGREPLKRVMFLSDSCYPLSPHLELDSTGYNNKISEYDHYINVLSKIG